MPECATEIFMEFTTPQGHRTLLERSPDGVARALKVKDYTPFHLATDGMSYRSQSIDRSVSHDFAPRVVSFNHKVMWYPPICRLALVTKGVRCGSPRRETEYSASTYENCLCQDDVQAVQAKKHLLLLFNKLCSGFDCTHAVLSFGYNSSYLQHLFRIAVQVGSVMHEVHPVSLKHMPDTAWCKWYRLCSGKLFSKCNWITVQIVNN